jgi:hypothetical protein
VKKKKLNSDSGTCLQGVIHNIIRAAAVVMKTPAATAMVGAQTTINNQLKSATATETATMTATTMRMETKATEVAAAAEARPAARNLIRIK